MPLLVNAMDWWGTLLLLFYTAAFALPLQAAFLDGLVSARDAHARVTPGSPWAFFDRVVAVRLRGWKWFWALLLIVVPTVPYVRVFYQYDLRAAVAAHWALLELTGVLLLWLLAFLATLGLAPRCPRFGVLSGLSLLITALSYYGLTRILYQIFSDLPGAFIRYESMGRSSGRGVIQIPLHTFYFLALLGFGTWIIYKRVRKSDGRWFRIHDLDS